MEQRERREEREEKGKGLLPWPPWAPVWSWLYTRRPVQGTLVPLPTTPRTSVLRRGVQLSTPITNHDNNEDDREMRTNCNPPPKNIQSLMLALIRRLLVGPCYRLILQSGTWGKTWEVGEG
ncbi:hypothetical protein MC885_015844 [Smutsia gigantea]|nr:hypothetical protein MC885_015844 [Smutsia gigantea]